MIVWPCRFDVSTYAASGRDVGPPAVRCPACGGPTGPWSGYRRHLRADVLLVVFVHSPSRQFSLPGGPGSLAAAMAGGPSQARIGRRTSRDPPPLPCRGITGPARRVTRRGSTDFRGS